MVAESIHLPMITVTFCRMQAKSPAEQPNGHPTAEQRTAEDAFCQICPIECQPDQNIAENGHDERPAEGEFAHERCQHFRQMNATVNCSPKNPIRIAGTSAAWSVTAAMIMVVMPR